MVQPSQIWLGIQTYFNSVDGYCTRYKYFADTSEYITQLTPELLLHRKWCKSLQQPIRNEKLVYYLFQTEDSRFQWQRSHWTWCPEISIAVTMMNVLSQHISNPLYIFTYTKFLYMLNSPVPALHLLCLCEGSIHTKFHVYTYLLLHSLLVFYILT